jgi:spore germination protein KA
MRKQAVLQQHEVKSMESVPDIELSYSLSENITLIQQQLGKSDDLVVRRFRMGSGKAAKDAAVLFFDGMADRQVISEFIIKYMTTPQHSHEEPAVNELESTARLRQSVRNILAGNTVLLIDGKATAYLSNTRGWERRGVEEPETESVIRGPREGFSETISTNSALIRVRLKDPNLQLRHLVVGQRTQTDVNVMYVEGLADPNVVGEIIRRIQSINIDGVLESGYIEQLIEDKGWSPFPQIQNTERPDKVVANLLEGKVAILVGGTPFVLIAPAIFSQFYQSPEDYYERFGIPTLIRMIRFISMTNALLLPSLYIAFSSFHPEMIPSRLVIAMAAGRSTVPFPSVMEAFIMEVAIEILREASVRLPGPIGSTIGIVGALVIGEAAVTAGLVSPIMVIIVALTTIGSFASPSYSASIAIRVLRFPLMILAGMFGLYGIMLFLIVILIHLSSLKSFGVPYLTPLSPINLLGLRDLLLRAPFRWLKTRPKMFHPQDDTRLGGSKHP